MADPRLVPGAVLYGVVAHYSGVPTIDKVIVKSVGPAQTTLAFYPKWPGGLKVLPTPEAVQRLTVEGAWDLYIGEHEAKVRDAAAALRRAEAERDRAVAARKGVPHA